LDPLQTGTDEAPTESIPPDPFNRPGTCALCFQPPLGFMAKGGLAEGGIIPAETTNPKNERPPLESSWNGQGAGERSQGVKLWVLEMATPTKTPSFRSSR